MGFKKLALLSISMCLMSSESFADAKNFEGFNVQAGIGAQNSNYQNIDMVFHGVPGWSTNDTSSTELAASIGAGYTKAISDKFTLGAIVEYNPKDNSSGQFDYLLNGALRAANDGHTKFENQYNIAAVIGYEVADSILVYGKIGYAGYQLNLIHTNGDPADKYSIHGISYGAGAKKLVSEHIYAFAEFNYFDYSDKLWASDVYVATGNRTSNAYNGLVGIGYKF